jgi:hypothetical protein
VLVGLIILEFLVIIAAVVFVALLFVIAVVLMVIFIFFIAIIIYGILTLIGFGIFLIFLSSPIWLWFIWITFLFGIAAFIIIGPFAIVLAYFIP